MVVENRECLDASVLCASSEIVRPEGKGNMNEIAVSQRVYCVSSYFPFFSFF